MMTTLYFVMHGGYDVWFFGQDSKTGAIQGYTDRAKAERKASDLNKQQQSAVEEDRYVVMEVYSA